MARERLYLFDTTLRDGAQTTGVDFSLEDKRHIAKLLDDLGIDYIEGGYPGANPLDTAFFAKRPPVKARFAAFGMTKREGRSAANDPGVAALLDADADVITFVAKTWDYHVRVALGISLEDNLDGIAQSIAAARDEGPRGDPRLRAFLRRLQGQSRLRAAMRARPRLTPARAGSCSATPMAARCRTRSSAIVADVAQHIPGDRLGIHTHNDTENAIANSLAAIRAGARHVQGTLNGLGERCGNANLVSLIPTLLLKQEYAERFEIGVTPDKLATLAKVSHTLDELLNRAPDRHAPYVGASRIRDQGRHPCFRRAEGPAHL